MIKKHVTFILEDDNEIMQAALNEDYYQFEPDGQAQAQMSKELITQHETLLTKIENLTEKQLEEKLTPTELDLIEEANQTDLEDSANFREHHKQALALQDWIETIRETRKKCPYCKAQIKRTPPEYIDTCPVHGTVENAKRTP